MQWDVLCRVIDNHGDLGVCLRLSRQLCERGHQVRLYVDDARALPGMAPSLPAALQVMPWDAQALPTCVGDVVVEAFGCEPEAAYLAAMARRQPAPVWVNLEYLSAEPYVQRNHGLPSPVLSGPAKGLGKWFFYPGFSSGTGGLLREEGLLVQRQAFDGPAWLAASGMAPRTGERVVSLFCYTNPALPALLQALGSQPTLVLAAAGQAQAQCAAMQGSMPPNLRVQPLHWLEQTDYDKLLWACDLNVVRGEDSFVRAHWAGKPFLWNIYPQDDQAHHAKLRAWLRQAQLGEAVALLHEGFNGMGNPIGSLPELAPWRAGTQALALRLAQQSDLCTQLAGFVGTRMPATG